MSRFVSIADRDRVEAEMPAGFISSDRFPEIVINRVGTECSRIDSIKLVYIRQNRF